MAEQVGFKRNIGLFLATMIGIGAMMGPGIFALPSELAHMVGPLGTLTYLVMGGVTIFTALNYSELGAAIPLAGGGYSFVSRTLSRPVAFFTGWFFWIGNTLACAMYAVIFALTIRAYFWPGASVPLIVLGTTVVFGLINLRSMSEAIKLITIMNLIELAVLLGIGVLGLFHVQAPNLEVLTPYGWGEFVPSMALIYISFVGFELITVAAEEIIDPGKNIPRSILLTLGIGVAIYIFVVGVMFATVSYEELGDSDVPFILVAERVFGDWGRWAGIVATIMASLSAFSVTLGASARVLYALGRDRHFPPLLARLHTRYQTPHVALAICMVMVVVFGSTGVVKFVASVSDFGYLMGLGIVNWAVVSLRKKMPALRRPFDVGWFPFVPIAGVISCWIFVPFLEWMSFLLGGALTVVGGAVYLTRPSNRAVLRQVGEPISRLKDWYKSLRSPRMRVLIIDGGKLGQNIATRLLAKDEHRMVFRSHEHQITFVEQDEATCQLLEKRYACPIYQGDGTKTEVLQQVGVDNVDVAIAASQDDGKNVIAALQAKSLGMKQVIAVVQDPDYMHLLEDAGVMGVSAPWATAGHIENYLDRPGVANLFEIGKGIASLVGVKVPDEAQVIGKAIKDIEIPAACVVAAIIRGNEFVVPRGNTEIEAGDEVVFIGPNEAIIEAQDHFSIVT